MQNEANIKRLLIRKKIIKKMAKRTGDTSTEFIQTRYVPNLRSLMSRFPVSVEVGETGYKKAVHDYAQKQLEKYGMKITPQAIGLLIEGKNGSGQIGRGGLDATSLLRVALFKYPVSPAMGYAFLALRLSGIWNAEKVPESVVESWLESETAEGTLVKILLVSFGFIGLDDVKGRNLPELMAGEGTKDVGQMDRIERALSAVQKDVKIIKNKTTGPSSEFEEPDSVARRIIKLIEKENKLDWDKMQDVAFSTLAEARALRVLELLKDEGSAMQSKDFMPLAFFLDSYLDEAWSVERLREIAETFCAENKVEPTL